MLPTIHLLTTLCLLDNPTVCRDIDYPTPALTLEECRLGAQPFLAQVKPPEWGILRYSCVEVKPGREA